MARRIGPNRDPVLAVCSDGERGHPFDRCYVLVWHGNYSAFNGYRFATSDYSLLRCADCGAAWRTSAGYVEELHAQPASGDRWIHDLPVLG